MTRLESAARDFAIACLARGDWMPAEAALSEIGEYAAAGALWRGDRRVHARVALYLRLLRRVEAWERGGRADQWAAFRVWEDQAYDPQSWHVMCPEWLDLEHTYATPWRPLWLYAPPFSAEVTPAMRRARSISEP